MAGALDGIRILDLSRVLAAPFAAQMLGDLGADVIKVERPVRGDDARHFGSRFLRRADGTASGESGFYLSANRSKRSICIDLARKEGQDIVLKLAAQADVIIENYKSGTLARYGLDYDAVRRINPGIVYASLTGYGQTGPYATRPGYDAVFQAQAGWMDITGEPDGQPLKTGASLADITSGLNLSTAIIAALYHRDARGGSGQYLDIGLLDCTIAAGSHVAVSHLVSGQPAERLGNLGNGGAPAAPFDCADGAIYITAGSDAQFRQLCAVLALPELVTDPIYRTLGDRFRNRDTLLPRLEAATLRWSRAQLLAELAANDVPAGAINDMAAVFKDEQVIARGMKLTMRHPLGVDVDMVANPLNFSATPIRYDRAPPMLGQHTREILAELQLSDKEIDSLAAAGIIGEAQADPATSA